MSTQVPGSLPTTMTVSECPVCEILTPQLKFWSYQTLIGQYCFDCHHLMYNKTHYSVQTDKHQKLMGNIVLEAQGKGLVSIVDDIPIGTDTLWPWYHPRRSREGFQILR